MWTPNRERRDEFKEEVEAVDFSVKDMLMYEISNTTIDYNRGFNKLWDMGWDDSKDKKYYMLDKPIPNPNFINVGFILEKIILRNNDWIIDKKNVYPAVGGWSGCQNVEISFSKTDRDLFQSSLSELVKVAREVGYEPVKGCPITFSKEVLFRKIGTWNKPYIMRKRRSQYLKAKWGYLSESGIKELVDCYRSRKFKETPYLRKKDEVKREKWYSLHLSQKMPKHLIEELNKWFDILKEYEWIWDTSHSDDDDESVYETSKRVKEFMKNSKLGLRTLWKNASKLFPVSENGYETIENIVLKYEIAWKMYDRIASSWCKDWRGYYTEIMGIGPDHANNQGNYYL